MSTSWLRLLRSTLCDSRGCTCAARSLHHRWSLVPLCLLITAGSVDVIVMAVREHAVAAAAPPPFFPPFLLSASWASPPCRLPFVPPFLSHRPQSSSTNVSQALVRPARLPFQHFCAEHTRRRVPCENVGRISSRPVVEANETSIVFFSSRSY